MRLYRVDPISDPRWADLLSHDARATIFHSTGWLQALRETYSYEPVVFTTSLPSQPLRNGVVFCNVKSWFTGQRLVSLPFSDHCEPLVDAGLDPGDFIKVDGVDRMRYVELRPVDASPIARGQNQQFREGENFWLHRLDLSPRIDAIFQQLHRDCVRRKIHKAEKESIVCQEGNAPELLDSFYRLQLRTRWRHRLPPQPKSWFRNLARFLGDNIKIRVASNNGRPIASILTFSFKNRLFYKYGCSDERYHRFGGMQLLLWRAIEEAKEKNYSEFDLGRCAVDNFGLQKFKDRWGARRSRLTYWRLQPGKFSADRQLQIARKI